MSKYTQIEKMLPQSIEAEYGVLGSIIIDPEAVDLVIDFLQVEDFYRDAHRMIYETIVYLTRRHEPVDFITICDTLERKDKLDAVGGAAYVTGLINHVPTSGNAEYYANIVQETAILRRLIHVAGQIASLAYDSEDARQTMIKAEELVHTIGNGRQRGGPRSISDIMSDYVTNLEQIHALRKRGVVTGVPTRFTALDKLLGGLQPSDLITLAARPGHGKTSLALNIASQVADGAINEGRHVLFFSLEMAQEQLARRLVSMETGIDQTDLRGGFIDGEDQWKAIVDASDRISAGQMWIDDTPGLSVIEMQSRARRIQAKHGIDLIVVDYMQLMKATTDAAKPENRVVEVGMISGGLKQMARELKVPVLALAQLSRAVETRADKKPQLSDLRESGAIEQDSDIVMFLHHDQSKGTAEKNEGYMINVLVEKQRNGPTGEAPLWFDPRLTRFYNYNKELMGEQR